MASNEHAQQRFTGREGLEAGSELFHQLGTGLPANILPWEGLRHSTCQDLAVIPSGWGQERQPPSHHLLP